MPNFLSPEGDIPSTDAVPSYLLAADNHNLGNTRGGSWLDAETWSTKFSNAGKLISTGMLSGANSFYNTGVTVGNWFGAEAEQNDTKDWISGIDSDLGMYYSDNRDAADLVGFIAGSFLPGLGGVKVFNAGQTALKAAVSTGKIGGNLSRATGLLVPSTEKYISLAARDINAATATFSSINANGIKALTSGFGQNFLESVAFETAVQATMFKSPILDAQDGWDIAKNIAVGGALGGVIGGAFTGASSLGKIRKEVSTFEKAGKPFTSIEQAAAGTSPAEKIILLAEQRELQAGKTVSLIGDTAALDAENLAKRTTRIDNEQRTAVHEMVRGEDSEIGNMVADSLHAQDSRTSLNNLLHAEEVARPGTLTQIEKEANQAAKEGKVRPELQTQYVKLTGEGAGVVSETEPLVLNLADKVRVSAKTSTEMEIKSLIRGEKFSLNRGWSAMDLSGATAHLDAEKRQIWASTMLEEVKPGSSINQYDLPLLERALADGQLDIKLVDGTGAVLKNKFLSGDELRQHLIRAKDDVAAHHMSKVLAKGAENESASVAAISKIVNVKVGRLEGTNVGQDAKDYFAWQTGKEDYAEFLKSKGLSTPANASADPRFLPTYAKVSRRVQDLQDINGHVVDGMTWIKTQQKLLKEASDRVVAKAVGDLYEQIPEIPDSLLLNANRYGAGAKLLGFANGGYGSLESTVQQLGAVTKSIKQTFRRETADTLDGPLHALGNNQKAAIEFQTIDQKITRSAKQWVRHTEPGDEGGEYLITKDAMAKYSEKENLTTRMDEKTIYGENSTIDFDSLNAESPEELILINHGETARFLDHHIGRSGSRTSTYRELRAAQGHTDVKDPLVYRPIRPSPSDYPFFAFVKDPRVTGQGHMTMLHASSEGQLQELINKVPKEYQTLTKRDTEDFFKARNEYEYQRTLHESYIDTDLKNRGVFSSFFTKTDPQKIVNDILQQHLREDDMLAVELMRAKNQKAFDWLEDQGSAYTRVSASKFGSYSDRLEKAGKNPYLDYIKTGLDISKASENPLIYGFNKYLDSAVSRAVGNVKDLWKGGGSDANLALINQELQKAGLNTAYYDAATNLLVNHTAPKGELTRFIRGANAVLSRLTLGLDPLNALNNFIGANILRNTELKQITDAIKDGNTELAGQLGQLSKINLPGGVGSITAPTKLVASALKAYAKDDGTLVSRYTAAGWIKDSKVQFRDILDDFTLRGTESVGELNSRLSKAIQKTKDFTEQGEKLTGNFHAEQLNRFVSANVMDQITSLGVSAGVISKEEAHAYISTFVNRVEGNTIASQRPLMFQGPVGQAIGLFQSYQFNLMQQMFRYAAEGTAKDAAMLLGLQGTFYGIGGLPAFQAINQHIVGTASGNNKHVDLYDSTYGIAGKEVGDLLMYGLPSNLLQANLYSRGDINPRQVTVLPTSLSEVPIVGAYGKFFGAIKDTVDRMSQGAPVWESMLQGLEHNGLSRPLAGIAQTLQATTGAGTPFSTTSKGSILFSNDLASWATATRLAGGRPLDEAILNDATFRIQSYQQYDRDRMKKLGESIKTSSINGQQASADQITKFAGIYAENGGKQTQFNKFMMNEYKAANTSQSQAILANLQHPFAQKMQILMGGTQE